MSKNSDAFSKEANQRLVEYKELVKNLEDMVMQLKDEIKRVELLVNGNPDGNEFQGISHLILKESCKGCTCGGNCNDKK